MGTNQKITFYKPKILCLYGFHYFSYFCLHGSVCVCVYREREREELEEFQYAVVTFFKESASIYNIWPFT